MVIHQTSEPLPYRTGLVTKFKNIEDGEYWVWSSDKKYVFQRIGNDQYRVKYDSLIYDPPTLINANFWKGAYWDEYSVTIVDKP
jgi:hypothetical protein